MAITFFGMSGPSSSDDDSRPNGSGWHLAEFPLPAGFDCSESFSERGTCPQCGTALLSSEAPDDVAKLVNVLSETPPNVTRQACPKCGFASELINLNL